MIILFISFFFISTHPFVRVNIGRAFGVLPCVLLAGVQKNIYAFPFCTLYTLAFSVFEACMAFCLNLFTLFIYNIGLYFLFYFVFLVFFQILVVNIIKNDQVQIQIECYSYSNTLKISFLSVSTNCNMCPLIASMISSFSES